MAVAWLVAWGRMADRMAGRLDINRHDTIIFFSCLYLLLLALHLVSFLCSGYDGRLDWDRFDSQSPLAPSSLSCSELLSRAFSQLSPLIIDQCSCVEDIFRVLPRSDISDSGV